VTTGVLKQGSLTFGAWGEPVRRALALAAVSGRALVLIDDSTAAGITNQGWSLSPADDVASLDVSPMTLHALALPVDRPVCPNRPAQADGVDPLLRSRSSPGLSVRRRSLRPARARATEKRSAGSSSQ